MKLTREENAQLSNTFVPNAISQITLKKLAKTQIPVDQVNETNRRVTRNVMVVRKPTCCKKKAHQKVK